MNRFLLLLVLGFGFIFAHDIQAATIFESAALGQTGWSSRDVFNQVVPGFNVGDAIFQGVRFELTQPAMTTQVGGHFVTAVGADATFFGAIIALDNENDFPDSEDLSTPDVLGSTILTVPDPSDEVLGNLELSLNPGWYGLVFGSGLFGATGEGGALTNNIVIGSPDVIVFQAGFGWGTSIPGERFVINGTIVPEPTTIVLAISASLLLMSRKGPRRF